MRQCTRPRGFSTCLTLVALALGAATDARAGTTRLLLPKDGSLVSGPKLLVLGKADPLASLPVRLEAGGKVGEALVKSKADGSFQFYLPLAGGRSLLEVDGQQVEVFSTDGGGAPPDGFRPLTLHGDGAATCEDCHEGDLALRRGGYPGVCLANCHEIVSHNPAFTGAADDDRHFRAAAANCSRCHDPHGATDPDLLVDSLGQLCGRCHGDWGNLEDIHPAFDEGECAACHDPHFSGFPQQLRRGVPALCGDCHAEPLSEGHGEELEECGTCHDPHGRVGSGMLRDEVGELCGACHDDIGLGQSVHPALDEGCNACHDPHRSDDLARARGSCGDCHELEAGGPVAAAHGDLELPAAACSRCHLPHAGEAEHLLRGRPHDPVAERDCSACHETGEGAGLAIADVAGTCEQCHEVAAELRAQGRVLHDPVAEGDCTACHDPHLARRSALLVSDEAPLCGECHEVLGGAGRTAHSATETCSSCHDPHGGTAAPFLRSRPPELCFDCHDDPQEAGGTVHEALDEGCSTCHDPHQGFPPANLRSPAGELCLDCHDDPAAGLAQRHGAVKQGCSGCHEPHASKIAPLLRAAPEALCSRCHPFAVPQEGSAVHAPVEDCGECHTLTSHGGAQANFLATPAPELCLNCHDDPREGEGEPHPALEEGCLICHSPHRGFAPGLLRGSSPRAACVECHDDPLEGKAVVHAPAQRSCAACHQPHAGPNAALLLRPGNGLCLGCHDVASHGHSLDAVRGSERFPAAAEVRRDGGQFACVACHRPHASDRAKLMVEGETFCQSCHPF